MPTFAAGRCLGFEESDQTALALRTAESRTPACRCECRRDRNQAPVPNSLSLTAIAERVREIARQLETTLERLAQQAEGLAREGDRAASQHAEKARGAKVFS